MVIDIPPYIRNAIFPVTPVVVFQVNWPASYFYDDMEYHLTYTGELVDKRPYGRYANRDGTGIIFVTVDGDVIKKSN